MDEDVIAAIDQQCAAVEALPFQWGTSDCGTFAQACVRALGGPDFLTHFDPKMYEQATASQAIDAVALFRSAHRILVDHGARKVPAWRGMPGDLAFVRVAGRHALGIMYARGWAVARAPIGWMAVPSSQVLRVWAWR